MKRKILAVMLSLAIIFTGFAMPIMTTEVFGEVGVEDQELSNGEISESVETGTEVDAEAETEVSVKKTSKSGLAVSKSAADATYTMIEGNFTGTNSPANLFDGDSSTMWSASWSDKADRPYVIFKASKLVAVEAYNMTTSNSGISDNIPGFWKLYGANKQLGRNDEGWEQVDDKSVDFAAYGNGGAMYPDSTSLLGTSPNVTRKILLNNSAISEPYQYFKLEIEKVQSQQEMLFDNEDGSKTYSVELGELSLIAADISTEPAVRVVADNGIISEKTTVTFSAANVAGNLRSFIRLHANSNITVDVLADCNLGDLTAGEENDVYITVNLNGHTCKATYVSATSNHLNVNAGNSGIIESNSSDYLFKVERGTVAGFGGIGYGYLSLNAGKYYSSAGHMYLSTSVAVGECLGAGYIAKDNTGKIYTKASTDMTVNATSLEVYECDHPAANVTNTADGFSCSKCGYDSKKVQKDEDEGMTEAEQEAKAKSLYDSLANSAQLIDAENSSASNSDPYGYGVGTPFMLSEELEPVFVRSNGGSSGMYWKDTIKNNSDTTNINSDAASGVYTASGTFTYSSQLKNISFIQAVEFDPTGSGRKTHIAYTGVRSDKHLVVWVYDTKQQIGSNWVDLGDLSWVTDRTYPYEMINYLAITAGDYNGNGKEEIVVYTPGSGTNYGLCRVSVASSTGSITIKHEAGAAPGLLNPGYNDTASIKTKNSANGRNRLAVDLATGDVTGDGIDDLVVLSYLNRVDGSYDNFGSGLYCPYLVVSKGAAGINDNSLLNVADSRVAIRDGGRNNSGVITYVSMMAPGMDTGDIDGDGVEEIIVGGAYNATKTKKNSDATDSAFNITSSTLSLAVYGYESNGKFSNMLFDMTSQSMPAFTAAGITGDQVLAPVAVNAAAMDGKGNPATVFIGGNLYKFTMGSSGNNSGTAANMSAGTITPNKVYSIPYFQSKDSGCGNNVIDRNFVQSVAVGNFDGNDQGYEQIYYTVGLRVGIDHTEYSYLYGRTYSKTRNSSTGLTTAYGATHSDTIQSDGNRALYNKCQSLAKPINFIVTACDKDDDGLLARYNKRYITFADPQVLAVLQAVPFFGELEDAGYYDDPSGCTYSISESREYTKGTSNSVSFGAGAALTLEGTIGGFDLQAGYALDWSESYEESLETESSIEFTATYYDQVVVGRTPVYVYSYDVWKGNAWENNSLELSVAQAASYAPYTLDEYNMMAEYYNAKMSANGGKSSLPVLDADSLFLGNEGDPFSYINTEKNKTGYKLLTNSKIVNRPVSGASAISYSRSTSSTKTTEMAHGFTFDLTVTFGFDAGFVESKAGGYVNLQYMNGTSQSETIGKSLEYTITGINPNGPAMQADGISANTTNAYSYVMNLASWEDSASGVQIVGTALSNLSAPPLPVEGLEIALKGSDLNISWEESDSSNRAVDGYNVYLQTSGGKWKKVNDDIVTDDNYDFRGYNNSKEYTFMVVAVKKNGSGLEIESIPSEEITFEFETEVGPNNYRCLDGHTWKLTSNTEATCYVPSSKSYACEICGATKTEDGEKLTHDMIDNVVPATCKSIGYTTHICKNCGYTTTDSIVTDGDHKYTEVVLIDSDCSTDGKALKICSICGDTEIIVLPKLGHSFTKYVYDENASFTAEGTKTAVCDNKCGASDVVTATGTKHAVGDSVTVNGMKYTITSTTAAKFIKPSTSKTITVPKTIKVGSNTLNVTAIDKAAFKSNTTITSVTIESADTVTPCGLFTGCTKLTSVKIGTKTYTIKTAADRDAIGHKYKATTTKATLSANGKTVTKCSVCGNVKSTVTIKKVSSVALSTSTYSYDGKTKSPSVTVKNSSGTKLVKGTDYTVTYQSGRTAIGKYKVTVKGTGKYSFTKTLYFKINPKKPTIKSVTVGSKKLTVKMSTKVASTGGTSYKIAYRVSGTSKWTYKRTTSQSVVLSGLKKGKKYNIKVCALKKVGTTTYEGEWTSVKTSGAVK